MNSRNSFFQSSLEAWILLCAVCSVGGWLLSALGQLNAIGYGVYFVGAAVILFIIRGSLSKLVKPRIRLRRYRKGFPLGFAVVATLAILGGILHGPGNYDGLAYRTTRVLHWLAEDSWHWIHTDFNRLNTRGNGMEWLVAPLIEFTGSDRLVFVINAVSFLFLPGLIFGILRGLGAKRKVAYAWMWIIPCGYCYILQAGSIANDLFGATLSMAALYLALRTRHEEGVRCAFFAILAAALMTSVKGFNLLFLAPWGLAMLHNFKPLLSRPIATAAVCLVGVFCSLVPTGVLNHIYCGDWKGLKAEGVNLSTGKPVLHTTTNLALVSLHNLNPPINPLAGIWNRKVPDLRSDELAADLDKHFEKAGATFYLGEMQVEEAAGIGFGVTLAFLPVLLGFRGIKPLKKSDHWKTNAAVIISAFAVVLYFFSQSGLGCPARYLAPFYAILMAPFLIQPRALTVLSKSWWRVLVYLGYAAAAVLLIVSPPRPLWPALSVLKATGAAESTSPKVQRLHTVYSVYADRPDAFKDARARLPESDSPLGFVSFDDPETALWRPFGSRRILHITRSDTAKDVRGKGIEYVLVSDTLVTGQWQQSMGELTERLDAEIVETFDLTLRASMGPVPWHILRIRPATP